MFHQKTILIVEDNAFLALDLSVAIEELAGIVVGPTCRIDEALELVDSMEVAAAIVDCHLPDQDVAPLIGLLAERGVPFVLHVATEPPEAIAAILPEVPVLRKPLQPPTVVACLLIEMRKASRARSG